MSFSKKCFSLTNTVQEHEILGTLLLIHGIKSFSKFIFLPFSREHKQNFNKAFHKFKDIFKNV